MVSDGKRSTNLRLYNTLTRRKDRFKPLTPKKVKIFTCGPSIYQRAHIGNYRTFIYEDVLVRYLEYLKFNVERVLVYTDIEDKAVAEARSRGITVARLTGEVARCFKEESGYLKLKQPTYNPRSSTTVDQAVKIVRILMEKGFAYEYKDDIYYDPLKFKGFGKLFGLDMSRWPKKRRRFKQDTYPGMRWNLGDFILWRGCEPGEDACFDDALGFGRPSWNVQDPAMALKYLGEQIDIACGGIDNLWRHHDYTLAIAEGVTGKKFSNFWLHGGHLLVDGKKMSKSKGNILYPEHLIAAGFKPGHIRFYLMYGPYREKKNYTKKSFKKEAGKLDEFKRMVSELKVPPAGGIRSDRSIKGLIEKLSSGFERKMNDDLDVKGGFDTIYDSVRILHEYKMNNKINNRDIELIIKKLKEIDEVLKVIF